MAGVFILDFAVFKQVSWREKIHVLRHLWWNFSSISLANIPSSANIPSLVCSPSICVPLSSLFCVPPSNNTPEVLLIPPVMSRKRHRPPQLETYPTSLPSKISKPLMANNNYRDIGWLDSSDSEISDAEEIRNLDNPITRPTLPPKPARSHC
ncbi:uncharacterized protein G2W53_003618 [Senna tora]|uniref:Uncharacterized protein n=1 Tax=Senna tora TaxID=362788 RepID=A0A835CIK9_9FABA|nr:uncharacterized protein G2W53_003618 [Senna tora]